MLALVLFLLAADTLPAPVPSTPAFDPAAAKRAQEVAEKLPAARHALREARLAAAALKDPPLRAAVEAQLAAPWLPETAWVYSHLQEGEAKLRALGLLAEGTSLAAILPKPGHGAFSSAPGGPCPTGHHSYPGGLAVHSWTNLLHARGLAAAYKDAYGIALDDGWLVASALWHDTLKSVTLPWSAQGTCPATEPQLAGTALHHPLGIAAAILRRLPKPLVWVIAAAHAPITPEKAPAVCGWIQAAGILAKGDAGAVACPTLDPKAQPPPAESYVNHFADADFFFTVPVANWYAAQTPDGWARYDALLQDGSDVAAWFKAQAHEK
jgi:hypothetical protein